MHETIGQIPVIRKQQYGMRGENALRLHMSGEVCYASAPVLEKQAWLRHGFTTRIGGVSSGEKASMNMSFAREPEHPEHVRENYRRISRALGIAEEGIVCSYQTHTANIRRVTAEDAGKGLFRERDYTDIDGLVTDVPGLTLAVFMSDCVPLLAADPVRRVIGAAHSGWRGTVSDIGGRLIREMHEHYGSEPENVICVIGPSICGDCYEVSDDVAQSFRDAYDDRDHDKLLKPSREGHVFLNLWEACRLNFTRAGVSPSNITVTDLCTKCNPSLLFSHRVQQGRQGNMAAMISII